MIQVEGFNVRIVSAGDRYGRGDCITHDGAPLVEFYDSRHQLGPRGQFVSRYCLDTLLSAPAPRGLMLDGGHPQWSISTKGMEEVRSYLRRYLASAA